MKFSDYKIKKSIKKRLEELNFKRPTDIQFKAIQPILDGEDVMAVAQTGTGKTATFVIPLIHQIGSSKEDSGIQAIVLVPTRELALQITDVFNDIGKYTTVKTIAIIGGVEQDQQIKKLIDGVHVIVATPGRMFDLIHQGYCKVDAVKFLVLDESDRMLDLGFNKDIHDILKKIPRKRQTLFFSATISKKIKALAYDVVRNAIRIQISPKNPVAKTINHVVSFIEMDDKRFFLENMLTEYPEKRFIVFARTKVRVERVVAAMVRVNLKSEALHGGIDQNDRLAILDRFKAGENLVLITTDVAARGIDIPNVDYVINYDLPDDPENYVHRCGRTGRGGQKGDAISFCSNGELEYLKAIEEYTGDHIERYEISKSDYEAIKFDTEDPEYNWKKLIDQANKEDGTENEW